MLLLALRGNAFLYQGEELGLPTAAVPFDRLQDPDAILNWPVTLGRDGARTPMPWIGGAPDAGFSRSEEHTSELQSLMRNSYAVFCLKKNNVSREPPQYSSHTDV